MTEGAADRLSRPGLLFAALGLTALALPFVQLKPNRILPGEGVRLDAALGPGGWMVTALCAAALLAGIWGRLALPFRLAIGVAGCLAALLALGASVAHLAPEADTVARLSPASGFWLLALAFAMTATDALSRLQLSLAHRALLLVAAVAVVAAILGSGWLDGLSVMREFDARRDLFQRETARHLLLAFGSLGAALVVGLPLGVAIYLAPRLRGSVLGVLNILQTLPSLALFGIMIPIFGWVAATLPGAAALGIAGIGAFPALVALFLYSLLPVVLNTLVGLTGVDGPARDAAYGLGMTRAQVLTNVQVPLALPAILAAVRIALVQNIGLAVIAGLIGGGGYGTFVFQGLNQMAMDLVLLGALPTIAMALVAGMALDLLIERLSYRKDAAA